MRLFVAMAFCVCLSGCVRAQTPTASYEQEVEISPGRWLKVKCQDTIEAESDKEWSGRSFEWKGKQVNWSGPEVPITLREHGGLLYMVGFNRVDLDNCRFVLFKLNDAGDGFIAVEREEFPKQIATQNLWLRPDTRYQGVPRRDTWKPLRDLDISYKFFGHTFTAKMWNYLETGKQYDQQGIAPHSFLRQYVDQYKPIALPTIVKEGGKRDEATEEKRD